MYGGREGRSRGGRAAGRPGGGRIFFLLEATVPPPTGRRRRRCCGRPQEGRRQAGWKTLCPSCQVRPGWAQVRPRGRRRPSRKARPWRRRRRLPRPGSGAGAAGRGFVDFSACTFRRVAEPPPLPKHTHTRTRTSGLPRPEPPRIASRRLASPARAGAEAPGKSRPPGTISAPPKPAPAPKAQSARLGPARPAPRKEGGLARRSSHSHPRRVRKPGLSGRLWAPLGS